MKSLKLALVLLSVAFFSHAADAATTTEICCDAYGEISVVDGNVTIKDGIGDVGSALTQKVIATISSKYENGRFTTMTVQKVTYSVEENVRDQALVLCSKVIKASKSDGELIID